VFVSVVRFPLRRDLTFVQPILFLLQEQVNLVHYLSEPLWVLFIGRFATQHRYTLSNFALHWVSLPVNGYTFSDCSLFDTIVRFLNPWRLVGDFRRFNQQPAHTA
jgi:hypothetical protein